jgi:hypothetical protein
MNYVEVQVPERDLAAVYELLARSAGASRHPVTTLDNGSDEEETVEHDCAYETAAPSVDDGAYGWVIQDWQEINNDARKVARVLANTPQGERLNAAQIGGRAKVSNVGAAMMSIFIRRNQRDRSRTAPALVERRRDNKQKKTVYFMYAEVTAVVRKLPNEEA